MKDYQILDYKPYNPNQKHVDRLNDFDLEKLEKKNMASFSFIRGKPNQQGLTMTINTILSNFTPNFHTSRHNYIVGGELYQISTKKPHYESISAIALSNQDLEGIHLLHTDVIVAIVIIANFNVKQTLIDLGSLANIRFANYDKFIKQGRH